jgi:hypothetical protein
MSKIQIREKVSKKKIFFYRNKLKTFFQVLRAFSRKITFLAFFDKTHQNPPKPNFSGPRSKNFGTLRTRRFLYHNAHKSAEFFIFL